MNKNQLGTQMAFCTGTCKAQAPNHSKCLNTSLLPRQHMSVVRAIKNLKELFVLFCMTSTRVGPFCAQRHITT